MCIGAALGENLYSGFLTRSDTNRAVQPHGMARCLKFQIYDEGLYNLCSENKGVDQLLADLGLCFHISKKRFSHDLPQLWVLHKNIGCGFLMSTKKIGFIEK